MNENIVKPMSVARQEFIGNLINEVNNCQLPMFVVEYVLEDVLNMVRTAAQRQYESEKAQYEQQFQNEQQ